MTENKKIIKNNALIGYTGFIGGNILGQGLFEYLYNTENIEDAEGKEFDLVICAAAPSIKWLANKKPQQDFNSIKRLMDNLKKIKAQKFVLISTIDVYPDVNGVDEDFLPKKEDLSLYGKHRRILEEFIENRFNSTIIRLPAVFGKGLKKNIIYDFLHGSFKLIHQDSIMQFYCLKYIFKDINKALENNLKIINFATEPMAIKELAKEVFDFNLTNNAKGPVSCYDMHTKYGHLWGNINSYLYSKFAVLKDIKSFVKKYKQDE